MKSDLDRLMQENDLDVILITGPAQHNPAMVYMTGGAHLTNADLIKKRDEPPILFHTSMERDEATSTNLQTKNIDEYRFNDFYKLTNGNVDEAFALLYQKMLADCGVVAGKLAIFGKVDAGRAYTIFTGLQKLLPELSIQGQLGDSILMRAMATKDDVEVDRIRKMGRLTTRVVGNVADFLTSHKVERDSLIQGDGSQLTIGDVKRRINLWLAESGAENPEGTIFAIGRDAGVPHSSGNPNDPLRLGQTIVFDIFPCEAGGGYFYDFTRTWCLGYAPEPVQAVYSDVLDVYNQVKSQLKVDSACKEYQVLTCDLFEARGHPTVKSNPQTQEGYVHGLGHGVGLNIHEYPRFSLAVTSDSDRLSPGSIVTVEPGLYYPERGLGVRLEDTIWVRPDGNMEILAEYPLDLVLPMK
jgi:Xaa-Pro aminopeptidase